MAEKTFYTPGPSQLYPTVAGHIAAALDAQIPSISHRSKACEAMVAETCENLRNLFNVPANHQIFFLASATEIWERIAQNCIAETGFFLVNGSFSKRFAEYTAELGKNAISHEVSFGQGFNLAELQVPAEAEIIATIVNETSSGVWTDPGPAGISALKARYPNKLIVADAVSAVPHCNLDLAQIDAMFFSIQKGFGLPAGLGVLILSPAAIEKSAQLRRQGINTGSYHSFEQLLKYAKINQSPETPNVLSIYLLGKVAGDMLKVGAENIRNQTAKRAAEIYALLEKAAWANPFVQEKRWQSPTVIVADVSQGANAVLASMEAQGCIIGKGYGSLKESQIRIANFPTHLNDDRILEALLKV